MALTVLENVVHLVHTGLHTKEELDRIAAENVDNGVRIGDNQPYVKQTDAVSGLSSKRSNSIPT